MKQIKLADFLAEGERRFGKDLKRWQFICPKCKTVITPEDYHNAGVPNDKINGAVGFNCIGRFTKDKGCDWTLGGLFQLHELEIEDDEGKMRPHFDFPPETECQLCELPQADHECCHDFEERCAWYIPFQKIGCGYSYCECQVHGGHKLCKIPKPETDLCKLCGLPHDDHEHCPDCGYSYCDCRIHGDHKLCKNPTEPARPDKESSGAATTDGPEVRPWP